MINARTALELSNNLGTRRKQDAETRCEDSIKNAAILGTKNVRVELADESLREHCLQVLRNAGFLVSDTGNGLQISWDNVE
jgi:hypothetical protein